VLIRPLINTEDEALAAKYLDSIRNLILRDTFTFDQAIQRFSEDKTSRTRNGDIINPNTGQPFFETGDLEPNVFFAIEKLKVGEMSQVLEAASPTGERYYRIIRLRNRTLPHVANLRDDYYRIYSAALEEKKNKALDAWVNKYISRHPVELSLDPNLKAKMGDISILERWNKPKP
jgi:peptidyl-prolyl cis-trans isomerase SurA